MNCASFWTSIGKSANEFSSKWVRTPLGEALGWTLIHSLWGGCHHRLDPRSNSAAMRSSRARYVAACSALLLMLGGFGCTLVRVIPEHSLGLKVQRSRTSFA